MCGPCPRYWISGRNEGTPMNSQVSNRHEGDLGGRLSAFTGVRRVGVTIIVAPGRAHLASVQHTAWMLLNILSRFDGIVERASLCCPRGVALAARIIPLASRNFDLRAALLAGAKAIGVVPVAQDMRLERTLVVGDDQSDPRHGDLHVMGNGWCGGVSVKPISLLRQTPESVLPFGPYVAACIAGGEIFKTARMRSGEYSSPSSAFYSVWDHKSSPRPILSGPSDLRLTLDAALAGVGAVGCSVMHALWACPGVDGKVLVADNDTKGLDNSNLNRYSLFGAGSVGNPKATAASQIVSDSPIQWVAVDKGFEDLDVIPQRVISAVDRNRSRQSIQNRYPARIFSGSTLDIRAEILRCGPPGIGACLRCYNEPEKIAPDEELRASLRGASENQIRSLAESADVTLGEARAWIETGKCGLPGERLLPHLRIEGGSVTFAVSFVSVMAGAMLAAELLKDHLLNVSALSASAQRAVFQFFSPLGKRNGAGAYPRHPNCPMCVPSSEACRIWADRYRQLQR